MGGGFGNGGGVMLGEGFVSARMPLGDLNVPLPSNLNSYIADFDAAVRLGKAMFWDIQAGSDNLTACATCHYNAGSDVRVKNQIHPGADGLFDPIANALEGPNSTLQSGDFPLLQRSDPNSHGSALLRMLDDRVGTQGLQLREFVSVTPGQGKEAGDVVLDPVFNVNGLNTSATTGRQAPSNINSVFFIRQFWDGRADFDFNGVNIWGSRDSAALVHQANAPGGALTQVAILLDHASLASQAVGPPMSQVEMSYSGKTFELLGRKLVTASPLLNQVVDPTDVHLGFMANTSGTGRGLTPGLAYKDMIEAAFLPQWWQGGVDGASGFTHMEENFSLYWGLAILCYQSELVSDQTPWDITMKQGGGAPGGMTPQQQSGWEIFKSPQTGCIDCHVPPVFGSGWWDQLQLNPEPGAPPGGAVERMAMANSGTSNTVTFSTVGGPTDPMVEDGQLVWFMPVDPRGQTLSIVNPMGLVTATVAVPSMPRCAERTSMFREMDIPDLPPPCKGGVLDGNPAISFGVRVTTLGQVLNDGSCALKMTINGRADVCAGLLSGDYTVSVSGFNIGVINMPPSNPDRVYDLGFYNLGLEDSVEDIGGGGMGPFGPLSLVERLQAGDPSVLQFDLDIPIGPTEPTATIGAFKAVSLRNIKYTGPYFHDGSMSTLEQVVQFYGRGGDFQDNNMDLSDCMLGMPLIRDQAQAQADLVEFLAHALLDNRVETSAGAFSHPSLPLKEGHVGGSTGSVDDGEGEALDEVTEIPATGLAGGQALMEFAPQLAANVSILFGGTTSLTEAGGLGCQGAHATDFSRQIRVLLARKPTAPVQFSISSTNQSELTVSPSTVSFNEDNWFHPVVIDVLAVQDGVADGLRSASVVFSPTSSGDQEFNALQLDPIAFTIADSSAEAGVLYVDPNAVAKLENGSKTYPYHSIGAALQCPESTSSIIDLGAFTYMENVVIDNRVAQLYSSEGAMIVGFGSQPALTIMGAGSAGTTIVGVSMTNPGGVGGGVLVDGSSSVLLESLVVTNSAGAELGGIMIRDSSGCILSNAFVGYNQSGDSGGGVCVENSVVQLINCSLSFNTGVEGGGLAVTRAGNALLQNCTISNNSAEDGGGLFVDDGTLDLSSCMVRSNHATGRGGGLLAEDKATLGLVRTQVSNNSSDLAHGGLYVDGVGANLTLVTLASNSGYQLWAEGAASLCTLNSTIVWGTGDSMAIGSNNGAQVGVAYYSILDSSSMMGGSWISADPLFVDGANGNHQVQSGSPAIDQGDPALGSDPDGTLVDIGSHRWVN